MTHLAEPASRSPRPGADRRADRRGRQPAHRSRGPAQVTKQSAGFLVDQLERAGYVERVPDPTDARARLVRISERGRAAQACAREMEQQLEAEFEAHLGPRRMRELRRSLESLREITDPYA